MGLVPGRISIENMSGIAIASSSITVALHVQILLMFQSLGYIIQMSCNFHSIPAMYSARSVVDLPQPTNLMRGSRVRYSAFLPVLVLFDIPRKIFKRLSKNLQKPSKLYCVTVFYAVIWVFNSLSAMDGRDHPLLN